MFIAFNIFTIRINVYDEEDICKMVETNGINHPLSYHFI